MWKKLKTNWINLIGIIISFMTIPTSKIIRWPDELNCTQTTVWDIFFSGLFFSLILTLIIVFLDLILLNNLKNIKLKLLTEWVIITLIIILIGGELIPDINILILIITTLLITQLFRERNLKIAL